MITFQAIIDEARRQKNRTMTSLTLLHILKMKVRKLRFVLV